MILWHKGVHIYVKNLKDSLEKVEFTNSLSSFKYRFVHPLL